MLFDCNTLLKTMNNAVKTHTARRKSILVLRKLPHDRPGPALRGALRGVQLGEGVAAVSAGVVGAAQELSIHELSQCLLIYDCLAQRCMYLL